MRLAAGALTLAVLLGVLLAAAPRATAERAAGDAPARRSTAAAPVKTRSTAALGVELRRFREIVARRRRPPGDKRRVSGEDLSVWGGRMHEVMNELGERLGAAGTPRKQVVTVMGEPDEVRRPGDARERRADAGGAVTEVMIYFWRGGHDYLYFELRGDAVIRSQWWMAGE